MEHLSAMSPWLNARLGEARFAPLQEAVKGLDFAMAAAILRDFSEPNGRRLGNALRTKPVLVRE
jgi:hypothetical protein